MASPSKVKGVSFAAEVGLNFSPRGGGGRQITEDENRKWRSAAEVKVPSRTGGDAEDNQRGGSGGQTQQGQGGVRNQPETHGHGPKISSYRPKSWRKKKTKGRGALCLQRRELPAQQTQKGG